MTLPGKQVELSNWSKSTRSACLVYQVNDLAGLQAGLEAARAEGLAVIPHGGGHSYTDAALNTDGIVLDVTPMRRILAWDARRGIMRVEAGISLQELVQTAWQDGWWPSVTPSTARVTIGGCAAMNVNGRNAWKCGPFGANILSLDVMLASGEVRTLAPEQEPQLFQAVVGSCGLLGIITSVTLQLQRLASEYVAVHRRRAAGLDEIFAWFAEEEDRSDFMEAWLDGFAGGGSLGRGVVTSATLEPSGQGRAASFASFAEPGRVENTVVRLAASLSRPVLRPAVQMANRVNYQRAGRSSGKAGELRGLVPYTFWPGAFFSGYAALLPEGVETFQAFVPQEAAPSIFKELLQYTQEQGCWPLWCVIKQHQRDPFLLRYQVDGFSLELNYARAGQAGQHLQEVLQHMIAAVIGAGGRFYLAKDHFMTAAQYRQSTGEAALEAFLQLKGQLDPQTRLQSDLFRRLFQPGKD